MTELRVYLLVESLARQFAAYMATPTRARGYPPLEGEHSLIIEVAPALAIHRVCDLALKHLPEMEPGLLYVERQYGILELHSPDLPALRAAGEAILAGIGRKAADQLRPRTLFADIIADVSDQHAIILNRTREASMLLPGQSLLLYELEPALFASVAANEAEKAAPGITLVDVQMIGASGRLFLATQTVSLRRRSKALRFPPIWRKFAPPRNAARAPLNTGFKAIRSDRGGGRGRGDGGWIHQLAWASRPFLLQLVPGRRCRGSADGFPKWTNWPGLVKLYLNERDFGFVHRPNWRWCFLVSLRSRL